MSDFIERAVTRLRGARCLQFVARESVVASIIREEYEKDERDKANALHAAIMNIQYPQNGAVETLAYREGHRDARHEAAELVMTTSRVESKESTQ